MIWYFSRTNNQVTNCFNVIITNLTLTCYPANRLYIPSGKCVINSAFTVWCTRVVYKCRNASKKNLVIELHWHNNSYKTVYKRQKETVKNVILNANMPTVGYIKRKRPEHRLHIRTMTSLTVLFTSHTLLRVSQYESKQL